MCGLFGIKTISKNIVIDNDQVKESALLMRHRGPNAYGQWGVRGRIELAHLRLSIVDLSEESNQPFFSNCSNYVVVFNGEIYNYIEIRNELQSLGYNFRTSSDTEVLLNSYIEWGEKCVSRFNGDWGFAIYNIKEDELFCSRDRFGVKPFNYSIVDGHFIFASEIKSILNYFPKLRTPNYKIISNFCRNSLGAQIDETWFEDIYRLQPAHNITLKNGEIKIERYWDYPRKTIDISLNEAKETYKEIFFDAVKLRMRSDVPVGTTLSSGLDSSSIVSVLRKFYGESHKTFTAVVNNSDFHEGEKTVYRKHTEINEADLVRHLASELNLESHLIDISTFSFVKDLNHVIYHLESGHSSPAILPLSTLLDYAKNHVTVIMEGQGADELLSGYIVNTFPHLLYEHLIRGNISQLIAEIEYFKKTYSLTYSMKQYFRLLNNNFIEQIYQYTTGIANLFGPKLLNYSRIKDYPSNPGVFSEHFNSVLFKSHTGGLVNLLHYGDAISMSKSIESRNPFVDFRLVDYSFKLPFDFKMHNGLGKYIHRISMEDIVPGFILNNPLKFGFNTPLAQYFDSFDKEGVKILLSDRCIERGLFDYKGLRQFIDEQVARKRNNATMLFRLLSVELWFRQFIDVSK